MSRESGIPTFRDAREGVWAQFDPEQLATASGFRAAPARVWSWYAYRRGLMLACRPHTGHAALVELQDRAPELTLITQNIDGLHQAAGSREVVELHGSIHRCRCIECAVISSESIEPLQLGEEQEPPICRACGGHLRPDVVWFGEMLPAAATQRAWRATTECDVLVVVGTSGLVWPAAELPHVAKQAGASVIEINPASSEVTPVADIFLEGPAGQVLPALVRQMQSKPR